GLSYRSHINNFLKNNNTLNISDYIMFNQSVFAYSLVNNLRHNVLNIPIVRPQEIHYHSTRFASSNSLALSRARNNYIGSSLHYGTQRIWNDLPRHVRDSVTLPSFKRALRAHLMSNY